MRRLLALVLSSILAGTAGTLAQTDVSGEIAGLISDSSGSVLPGVRVTIVKGNFSRELVTDPDGRFALRGLRLDDYRVEATLPGFRTQAGSFRLSPAVRRAYLTWSLEVGCITNPLWLTLRPREAAPLVDAIVHVRIRSANGSVLVSDQPDCSRERHEYSVDMLGGMPGRSDSSFVGSGLREIFTRPEAHLELGKEYLVMLWPNRQTTSDLVFEVVSGRVATPAAGELANMPVALALATLEKWSRARPR